MNSCSRSLVTAWPRVSAFSFLVGLRDAIAAHDGLYGFCENLPGIGQRPPGLQLSIDLQLAKAL